MIKIVGVIISSSHLCRLCTIVEQRIALDAIRPPHRAEDYNEPLGDYIIPSDYIQSGGRAEMEGGSEESSSTGGRDPSSDTTGFSVTPATYV